MENITKRVRACRACLATDTKLYDMRLLQLAQNFTELTAIKVSASDRLPQFICNICRVLLLKYGAFRKRCRMSNILLKNAQTNHWLTNEYIKKLDKSNFKLQLHLRGIQSIDIEPDESDKTTPEGHYVGTGGRREEFKQEKEDTPESAYVVIIMENANDHKGQEIGQILQGKDNENSFPNQNTNEILFKTESFLNDDKSNDIEMDFDNSSVKVETKDNNEQQITNYLLTNSNKVYKTETQAVMLAPKKLPKIKKKVSNKALVLVENSKSGKKGFFEKNVRFAKSVNCKYVCNTEKEQIQKVLARKESLIYRQAEYKCKECYEVFAVESSLKNHMKKHDLNRGGLVCVVCRFRFPTKNCLRSHKVLHKHQYICNECGHVNLNGHNAKRHYNDHMGVTLECKTCHKSFRKGLTYRNHVRYNHSDTPCAICRERFLGEQGLHSHMLRSHPEATRCETCGVLFQSAAALTRHTDAPCQPGHSACPLCGDSFTTEQLLKEHFEHEHRPKKKILECDKCDKTYDNPSSFMQHEYTAHGNEARRSYRPPRPGVVKRRRRNKGKDSIFMCETCGKTFVHECFLIYHMRIHTGEKPYSCSECSKTFRMPINLKMHMMTHTSAMPYECAICSRRFPTRTKIAIHIRSHTKEKPAKCPICDKGFMTNWNMKEHVETVHLGKPPRQRRLNEEQARDLKMILKGLEASGSTAKRKKKHTDD